MKKKLLSFILAVVMIVSMIPLGTLTAFADVEEYIDQFGWRERFGTYNGYDMELGELAAIVSFDESILTVDYLYEDMPEEYRHQSFSTINDATDTWIRYGEGYWYPTAECIDLIEGQLCILDFGLRLEKTVSSHNWRLERGFTDISDGQHYDMIRAVCMDCDDEECPYRPYNSGLYISLYLDDGKYPVIGPAEMVKEWKKAGLPAPQIHYYSDEDCTIDLGTSLPEFYSTFWAGVKVTPPSTEMDPDPEPVMISIEFRHEDVSKKYYYQGYGTQQDPYQISNLYQLIDLAKAVEGASEYDVLGPNDMRGKYFELVNDIGSMDEGMPISIGGQYNPFAGHFDGKGNTVYLDVSDQGYLNYGLFCTLSGKDEYDETEWCPTICNLTVAGTAVGVSGEYAPICSQNYGVIENCTNRVDAPVGICYENRGILRGCVNYGAVGCGGICGTNFNLVEECINYGEVTVGQMQGVAGGICGQNENLINGCINNGNIIGKSGSFYFGGICGVNEGTIVNCINNGGIIGDKADDGAFCCGGLCGITNSSVANIYNSINRADISASTTFAGICGVGIEGSGKAYEMCNCISIGSLDIPDHYATFYGLCEPVNFSIINSYFNGDKVESEELPDRDKALTTEQMKAESNEILDGEGLPQDGKALIDLLNGYIDTNNKSEDGWWYWIKDENGYPIPGKRTYKITVSDTEHGKVTIPSSYMEADTSVPVTVIPEDSYTLKSLKYKIGTGSEIDITSDKSFTMPEDAITVIAEFKEIPTHTHTLHSVEAKEASCTEDGISTTYYVCEGEGSCGKYFSDENGENEISAEIAQGYTIGKTGHSFIGNYINYEGNKWAKECAICGTYDTANALTGVAVPTAKTGLVYNGDTQTGVEAGTGYSIEGNTGKDAGTYTATAKIADGYIWADGTLIDKPIEWSIAKATVAVPAITGDKDNMFFFTGEEIVALEENEYYTVEGGSATATGKYTAKVTPTKNCKWNDGTTETKTIEWYICNTENYLTKAPTIVNGDGSVKNGTYNQRTYYMDGNNKVVLIEKLYNEDKPVSFEQWYLRTMVHYKREGDDLRLRFVTMLDENLDKYEEAGFTYSVEGLGSFDLASTEGYTSFITDGTTHYISEYSQADDFFVMANNLFAKSVVDLNPEFTVTPYVKLMDGTTLTGKPVTFHLSDFVKY